jgi:hypothetical protein
MIDGKVMQELRSLDERRIEIAEKIASKVQARLRGERIHKEELFALIDGLADEIPAEDIVEWKRVVGEDWDRVVAPLIQPAVEAKPVQRWHNGRRLLLVKPPPQAQQEAKTDEGPQIDAALSVSENTQPKGKADEVARCNASV